MMRTRLNKIKAHGFTLIELMIVILVIGILAAISIPMMSARVEASKWSEGVAAAGTIRQAAKMYYVAHGNTDDIKGDVSDHLTELGLSSADLVGTYFDVTNYDIHNDKVTTPGSVRVHVKARSNTGLTGTGFLQEGGWEYIPGKNQ